MPNPQYELKKELWIQGSAKTLLDVWRGMSSLSKRKYFSTARRTTMSRLSRTAGISTSIGAFHANQSRAKAPRFLALSALRTHSCAYQQLNTFKLSRERED